MKSNLQIYRKSTRLNSDEKQSNFKTQNLEKHLRKKIKNSSENLKSNCFSNLNQTTD